jgi:methyl-accepting chemotaxis protein
MLNDLRIHWKLGLLSAVFLCPVILLTCLLVNQSLRDIAFSAKERDGVSYIAPLRDSAVSSALAERDATLRSLAAWQASSAAMGERMNLGKAPARVSELVTKAAGQRGADAVRAMGAIEELIFLVGDGSNLILDPDLDSYYSMSLVVLKLPRALHQIVQVEHARSRPDRLALDARMSELRVTLAGIERDLAGAYRGNPDGSLQQAYARPFAAYASAAATYLDQVETTRAEVEPAYRQLLLRQRMVWQLASDELDRLVARRIDAFQTRLVLSLGASALVLLLAGLLAMLIWRSISRPIAALVEQMCRISAGDLTHPGLACGRADEMGLLTRTAAAMQAQLHGLTRAVRDRAGQVELGARTMGAAISDQAASATQVSTTVTEISAAMEELSVTSNQIAVHSKAVAEIANHTWENSKLGSASMRELLARMEQIGKQNQGSLGEIVTLGSKSKEISKIMVLINALADQTKLIAFNAALEASSAGEGGRRFGVVAAEIRRLADSVTASTGDIEERINDIQDAINRLVITSEMGAHGIVEGMRATSGAAARLEELVDAASQTSDAAQQISLSTQQQQSASGQVALALREIVEASAHGAESMARASRISGDMQATSDLLREVVGQFTLDAPQHRKELA